MGSDGDAFNEEPVTGTLPSQMRVSDYAGKRLVNSFLGGDGAQDDLWSQPFTLTKDFINLLVGGDYKPGECEVRLVAGGGVKRST